MMCYILEAFKHAVLSINVFELVPSAATKSLADEEYMWCMKRKPCDERHSIMKY